MAKIIRNTVVLGVIGLVVGYFLFARSAGGGYHNPIDIFFPGSGFEGFLRDTLGRMEQVRRNILAAGLGGAVAGLIGTFVQSGGFRR